MTIQDVLLAVAQGKSLEFYSTGTGWVALLDEGWHPIHVQEINVDTARVKATTYPFTIEVQGEDAIKKHLRLA